MFKKIANFSRQHKFWTVIIILAVVVGGYISYKSFTGGLGPIQYVLAAAQKGTIVVSVSGSGQVSASNQIDLKAKAAGNITYVGVASGQNVKAGTLLVQLDSTDAQKNLRDAQASLDNAMLALDKAKRGALPTDLAAAQLSVDSAQQNLTYAQTTYNSAVAQADTDLTNLYTDSVSTLQDTYNKADNVVNNQINDLFVGGNTTLPRLSFEVGDFQAGADSAAERFDVSQDLNKFNQLVTGLGNDPASIENALDTAKGYLTSISDFLVRLGDAVDSATNLSQTTLNTYKSTVSSAKSSVSTLISTMTSQKQAIASQKTTNQNNLSSTQNKITSAQNSLASAQNSLAKLQAGTDPLDINSQQLNVQQQQNAVADARQKISDYSIVAPFDGTVASLTVIKGNPVISNEVVGSFITPQSIAEISLNEVDAAKVVAGDKVTLTFDAVPDLTIAGQVAQIDIIGTVSQGVVSYNVKIAFDTQDQRVKPGMTVSASIVTEVKQDVLLVPNSAIKISGNSNYVEMINDQPTLALAKANSNSPVTSPTLPSQQIVQVGLSNDTNTEITSGLNEGDMVIIRTINPSTATASTASQGSSLFGIGGGNRTTGGTAIPRGAGF